MNPAPAKQNAIYKGFLQSRELKELAKPLAILLVLLFSLTVHINAALAAGGETSICQASRTFNNADDLQSGIQTQLEHCGVCLLSGQNKKLHFANDFEFLPLPAKSEAEKGPKLFFSGLIRLTTLHNRGPPISKV